MLEFSGMFFSVPCLPSVYAKPKVGQKMKRDMLKRQRITEGQGRDKEKGIKNIEEILWKWESQVKEGECQTRERILGRQ